MRAFPQCSAVMAIGLCVAATSFADVSLDGAYHNGAGPNPEFENVPGLGTPFRDVNSSTSRVTIRFLADVPGGDTNDAFSARVRFYSNREYLEPAIHVSNVVITAGAPFHATPAAGSITVGAWQVDWHPTFQYTGYVFYAPQLLAIDSNTLQTSSLYLIRDIGTNAGAAWGTNNFFWATQAQPYGANYDGLDYGIVMTNFLPNPYEDFYFNDGGASPATEPVPGPGVPFFEYNYASNQASFLNMLAPLSGVLSATARLYYLNGAGELYYAMTNWTTTVISSGSPFHGRPAAGDLTLAVWRASFFPPSGWGTNLVYFTPRVQVAGQTESMWLTTNTVGISDGVVASNQFNPPQYFASSTGAYFGRDIKYASTAVIRRTSLAFDWAYHNNTAFNPLTEPVPAYDGSTFLEVNYATTTTTFFVMTDRPFTAVPGEDMDLRMRIGWFNPQTPATNFVEEYPAMTQVTSLVLDAGAPFHGLPSVGSHTVLLWRLDWPQPTTNGAPITNALTIYYNPLLKSEAGSLQQLTDERYLVRSIEGATNGWGSNNYTTAPQHFGREASFHDYSYVNKPVSLDYTYFNNTNAGPPETELVPGLGVPFFFYNYESNQPGYFHVMTPAQDVASVTVRCYFVNGADETFFPASPWTNVVLSATNMFHGEPQANDVTVAVWRAAFYPPPNWTNNTMYFAPRLSLSNGESFWLVRHLDGATEAQALVNGWPTNPQSLYAAGNGYVNRDWGYTPTAAVARTGIRTDWAYHNHTNYNPEAELVPSYTSAFRVVHVGTSNTVFHFITDDPLNIAPGENANVQMQLTWTTNFVDFPGMLTNMSFVTNLVIDSAQPFHGLPAAGQHTVRLWRAVWPHPTTNGVPILAPVYAYYSFLVRTFMGSAQVQTDERYFIKRIDGATNNWGLNNFSTDPQAFGTTFFDHDYLFTNLVTAVDSDNDGIPDVYEDDTGTYVDPEHTGTDPLIADSDGDTQNDGDEVVAGTNPNSAASTFVVSQFRNAAGGLLIQWNARTGRLYNVESLDTWPTGSTYSIVHSDLSVTSDAPLQTNLPATAAQGTLRLRVRR